MLREERFWRKVNLNGPVVREDLGPCWIWEGHDDGHGYGRFSWTTTPHRRVQAHRAAWMLEYGELPDDVKVCHHCDVRLCVCLTHLFAGTQAENIADMVAKGRHKEQLKTECVNGHPFDGTVRGHRRCLTCHRDRERERTGMSKIPTVFL